MKRLLKFLGVLAVVFFFADAQLFSASARAENAEVDSAVESCKFLGGRVQAAQGGNVCSEVDANDTFCILNSADAFPCQGLFKHVRICNQHNRPALNPFFCGAICANGKTAHGDECAPNRRVDLAHLEKYCPMLPEENGINQPISDAPGVRRVGKWCVVSENPFRICYALAPAFSGLQARELEDDNQDMLSESNPPLNLCDNVLRFCPEGQTDLDGNYFTEGDCSGDPPPHVVDLTHLEEHCPMPQEEDGIYEIEPDDPEQPLAGKWCLISRVPLRYCYALAPESVKLYGHQLEDANQEVVSHSNPPLHLCDEVLQFCPKGQTDLDGNYFTEGDCSGGHPTHTVNLAHLEEHCPPQTAQEGFPRRSEESATRIIVGDSAAETHPTGMLAGRICELADAPFRRCYALKPSFAGLLKGQLELVEDNNQDILSAISPPLNLCDDVLRFCPTGQTDEDGNYFTEGDCVPPTPSTPSAPSAPSGE